MNKFLKLPLFLAGVCVIATGLLAAVNAITAPIIAQNASNKQNQGYLSVLGLSGSTSIHFVAGTLSEAAADTGLTAKKLAHDGADDGPLVGIAYDGVVQGYGGDITFQVGLADGYYTGFNVISNSETPTVGQAKVLNTLNDYLVNNHVAAGDDFTLQQAFITMTAGATYTKRYLVVAIEAAATDYLASI